MDNQSLKLWVRNRAHHMIEIDAEMCLIAVDCIEELEAKLAEVKASSQGWIDAAVEQQVRRKRAEERILEVTEDRDDALIALASARKQLERYIGEAEAERVAANDLRKRKRTFAKLRGATTPKEPN